MPSALIAIGGNALIKSPVDGSLQGQYQIIEQTAIRVVNLIEKGIDVIITHGNGPQVGYALYRSQIAQDKVPVLPFEYAIADTQGVIGYMFANALDNELKRRSLNKKVLSMVTRTLVDKSDPAFLSPDKPIGSYVDEKTRDFYQKNYNWSFIEDTQGLRRVVPSPSPKRILEQDTIKELNKLGFLLVCTGGGGVPVVENDKGSYEAIAAVIDKDRSSCILAKELNVDYFVIPTAVNKVCINFGKDNEQALDCITLAEAKFYQDQGQFAKGSMGPKVEAMMDYLSAVNKVGIICSIDDFDNAILHGSGTYFKR